MKENQVLEIKNLTLSTENTLILKDFSLELFKGEILGLYSPTGSGKTSLLNYIAGIIDKKMIKNGSMNLAEGTVISYAFQDFRLLRNCTVFKNIQLVLSGSIKKIRSPVPEERIFEFLKLAGLFEKKDVKAGLLSGGEQQRLSLIRSLIFPADLFLLDEPFNALSQTVKIQNIEATKKLLDINSSTAIIVSHDKTDLEFLCSKIISLNHIGNL